MLFGRGVDGRWWWGKIVIVSNDNIWVSAAKGLVSVGAGVKEGWMMVLATASVGLKNV